MALLVSTVEVHGAVTKIFTVNSTVDAVDANPGDGFCATAGAVCTLRAAVMESNHTSSATTKILFPAGLNLYSLTIAPSGANDETSGDLNVTRGTTIVGGGTFLTGLSSSVDRVLTIAPSISVTITDLSIQSGDTSGSGGGILNEGTLVLTRCQFAANSAARGGGIFSSGTLTVTSSFFFRNHATGTAALDDGGAILVAGLGATIANTTISENTSKRSGGGVSCSQPCTLYNVTLTDNIADSDGNATGLGGGVAAVSGTFTLANSIVSGNLSGASPDDCEGAFTSNGFNLVHARNASHCTIGGSFLTGDPLLGLVNDNGGSTDTYALLVDSPAVDAGNPAGCEGPNATVLAFDQRGAHRPAGAACDLGAYERNANGDVDGNGTRNVSDVFYMINLLFAGGPAAVGLGDVNGSGVLDVADVFSMINFLFAAGPAPL
jgi:CSLREA domain-containing protein